MFRFKHPFTCVVSGPSQCGKSTFCVDVIKNLKQLCTEPKFSAIVWCFSESSAVPKLSNVTFHKGIPNLKNATGKPMLIILDDLLQEAYSKDVCDLFTKGSHHRNISVILITQNLFHQSRFSRDISLNAKYIVIFKSIRDKNQFMYLARQVYPENSHSLYEQYLDATKRPHGYLLLDLAQETNDLLRFRTDICNPNFNVVYAPVDNDKDQIKLPRSACT